MNRDKDLYRELRKLPWSQLWSVEVPRFNAATQRERFETVAVIRAAAVVYAESGPRDQFPAIKDWLRSLLNDPQEKIRRYAIAALPKLGRDEVDEQQLLTLTRASASAREKKHLAKALGKIGGAETLRHADSLPAETIQRITAAVTRAETPSAIKLDASLATFGNIEILLHCRAGLETIVADEAAACIRAQKKFHHIATKTGLVLLKPAAPFTLAHVFTMRCFDELGFSIGQTRGQTLDTIADLITSRQSLEIFQTFTAGPIRYRLDFANKGHQRAAVRDLAQRIYARDSNLINGGGDTPWTIRIHSGARNHRIELVPKILPDPRFAYRRRDIPAASHPPLAACMARLAGPTENEIVWDPFCGSGLELIERCLLGGVKKIIGADLSAEALEIAQQNFAAAKIPNIATEFVCSDFRNFDPGADQITLIVTNPPLGRRVPIPNLRKLIDDLILTAARLLTSGGRLVLVNPFKNYHLPPLSRLDRLVSQRIDLGGFHCQLEKYRKP